MRDITYHSATGENKLFLTQWDEQGHLISLRNSQDGENMNWVKGEQIWGTVQCEPELTVEVERRFTERGTLAECYTFRMRRPLTSVRWEPSWESLFSFRTFIPMRRSV